LLRDLADCVLGVVHYWFPVSVASRHMNATSLICILVIIVFVVQGIRKRRKRRLVGMNEPQQQQGQDDKSKQVIPRKPGESANEYQARVAKEMEKQQKEKEENEGKNK
jgi:flagellar biosynthesis/type III secretory pathway M-ring protein FliF/YscJ